MSDRPEVVQSEASNQYTLIADTNADQQTLTGNEAAMQCLFEE